MCPPLPLFGLWDWYSFYLSFHAFLFSSLHPPVSWLNVPLRHEKKKRQNHTHTHTQREKMMPANSRCHSNRMGGHTKMGNIFSSFYLFLKDFSFFFQKFNWMLAQSSRRLLRLRKGGRDFLCSLFKSHHLSRFIIKYLNQTELVSWHFSKYHERASKKLELFIRTVTARIIRVAVGVASFAFNICNYFLFFLTPPSNKRASIISDRVLHDVQTKKA